MAVERPAGRAGRITIVTLLVALVTLAAVVAILLRPPATPAADLQPALSALRAELVEVRTDLAELRRVVEESADGSDPLDLSALESRLDRLEGSMQLMAEAIATMNKTARTICQMVADSPFTPSGTC